MKPPNWFVLTITAIVLWGFYGIALKLAADRINPLLTQVISSAGLIVPALFLIPNVIRERQKQAGLWIGFASGVFGAFGSLALIVALAKGGKTAIVFPLTALYPLVTVCLAIMFLRESARSIQGLGIALALCAVLLLSLEPGSSVAALRVEIRLGDWLLFALAALIAFGVTALLQKLATNRVSAESAFAMFAFGFIPLMVAICLYQGRIRPLPVVPATWAAIGGLFNGLGVLATLAAYRNGGKASIVTPLAALYPVITVLIAVIFLREPLNAIQCAGIGLAIIGGVCLSRE
jgi:bacterial/archaeal transporter family protein